LFPAEVFQRLFPNRFLTQKNIVLLKGLKHSPRNFCKTEFDFQNTLIMNYFAHGVAFLDRPYVLAGTATPDWLMVADRQVRLRARHVEAWLNHPDLSQTIRQGPIGQTAQGVLQHLADDQRFHHTAAFVQLSLHLNQQVAELLDHHEPTVSGKVGPSVEIENGKTLSVSPGNSYSAFIGHLLLEVLLDAAMIEEDPARLEEYYRVLEKVDVLIVQEAVNRMAARTTQRLAPMISEFRRLRILWDYLEDRKLLFRLNQVMRRVGLAELPEAFLDLLPQARRQVASRKQALLAGIPADFASSRPETI